MPVESRTNAYTPGEDAVRHTGIQLVMNLHCTCLQSIQDSRNLCNGHAKWRELNIDLGRVDERDVHSFDARSPREKVKPYQDTPCNVEVRHCHPARHAW